MVPLDKIRSDLKEIRYYYSRKAMLAEDLGNVHVLYKHLPHERDTGRDVGRHG